MWFKVPRLWVQRFMSISVDNIKALTKLIPADMTLVLYSQEMNDACSYMFSILLTRHRWASCTWIHKVDILSVKNDIAFPFFIPMLMCLSSFSDWPTPVIIVSHHNIALSSIQQTQIKQRLITIKPGINIMLLCSGPLLPHPFSIQMKLHAVDYDRHHFVSCLVRLVSGSQSDSTTENVETAPTWLS